MTKIIGQYWLGTYGILTMGVVAIETRLGGWKAYIGIAGGIDQAVDLERIAENGNKLQRPHAEAFFPQFKELKYEE